MADSLMMAESSHSIYVNRLASQEVNQLNTFWGSYYRLLMSALGGYDSDITQAQLNKVIREVSAVITESMEEWQTTLMTDLDEFAEYETTFQSKAISSITDLDIAVPATAQVIAAAIETPINLGSAGAVSIKEWLKDVTAKQKQRIENEIKLGYANGTPSAEIVRTIVGTRANKFTDGIADIDRRNAVTLVRTATSHYASVARKQVYKENKRVVIGHRWVSTLDRRTSSICRDLDGEEFIYSKGGVKYPPAHPGCRSSTAPIVKGYNTANPEGKRAARGATLVDGKLKTDPGQVSATKTYYDWLKTQPAQFQDEVLGSTRGKIFRNSGVSVERFKALMMDSMSKPLTIKEMAAKDKQIQYYLESLR